MSLEGIKEYDRIVYSARSKGRDSEIETQREEGKIGDSMVKLNAKFNNSSFKKYIENEDLPTTSQQSRKSKRGKSFD